MWFSFWKNGKFQARRFFDYVNHSEEKLIEKNTKCIIIELYEDLVSRAGSGYKTLHFFAIDYEKEYDGLYDYEKIKKWFTDIADSDPRFNLHISPTYIKLSWENELEED